MRLCCKHHKVTVTPDREGTFSVHIATDCDHIREYAKGISSITMEDVTEMKDSKVTSYDSTAMITPTCLVPKAVLYAAWIEIGMISPTLAKQAKENSIIFSADPGD
ncbi:MAG: hypothetical protein LBJ20_07015 [Candidatus Methanoplasma sp.]|nr:hypothetical protein [Candidatus Methanoplasma sp.]